MSIEAPRPSRADAAEAPRPSRADAAEASARDLIATDWTAAHNLANGLSPAQVKLFESSLIAAHVAGSAWAYANGER